MQAKRGFALKTPNLTEKPGIARRRRLRRSITIRDKSTRTYQVGSGLKLASGRYFEVNKDWKVSNRLLDSGNKFRLLDGTGRGLGGDGA